MIWLNKIIKIFMSIVFGIGIIILLLYIDSKIEWLLPLIMVIILTVIPAKIIYTWLIERQKK